MPTPNKNTIARKRPDIQDSVMTFDLMANNNKMIADRLFPMFDVGMAGGDYGRIPPEQLLQKADTKRASGAAYQRGEFEFEEAFFQTKENGWEMPVDERDKNLYTDYLDAEIVSAEICRSTILINRETRVRDKTFGNADIPETDVTAPTEGGAYWTDYAGSNPILDVENRVRAIYEATGLWPNALIMSYWVFRDLRQNERILDRIAANGAGDKIKATDVTTAQLAEVFDLAEIVIGGASENLGGKGEALDVGQIWGKTQAMVAHLLPAGSRNIRQPGLGRSFHWAGDGSVISGLQESYWEEQSRSEVERCRHETDERCTYPELGQRMKVAADTPPVVASP